MKLSILVIDDEIFITDSVQKILLRSGHEVVTANDGSTGLDIYRSQHFDDILIVDLVMPDLSGLDLIRKVKDMDPDAFIVVITGYGTIENAVEALKMGASDFLLKPITSPLLLNVINRRIEHLNSRRENQELRRLNQELFQQVSRRHGFGELIGLNPGILSIYKLIGDLLTVDVNILITGETGTGKELVARTIHQESNRKGGPFVAVNCGGISETLLQSELFGHEKGAFTGAVSFRKGKFELANSGTLFLDEVGNMGLPMQQSLLRVLETKQIERLGGEKTIPVDVRIVAATNADPVAEVGAGRFRQDLYYRLGVVSMHLPPLRERMDDLPHLVEHFVRKYREKYKKDIRTVSQKVLRQLMNYDWPGNVRQLEHVIERAIGGDRKLEGLTLEDFVHGAEKFYLERLLKSQKGLISKTADVAGISPKSLYVKMKKHNLKKEAFRAA
ncbi:MAG: sigma-54-dependent Fis family transcriptional regulator [Deltaproteobacteria bacterium]|nr:sigma-54-dependent Fis family transcriptional regulator [Deltaproteobacteria bacterium]